MSSPLPLHNFPVSQILVIEKLVDNPDFGETDQVLTRRLSDLGFYPGAEVLLLSKGLFKNGPYAVRVNHSAQFSLRRSETEKIICTVLSDDNT